MWCDDPFMRIGDNVEKVTSVIWIVWIIIAIDDMHFLRHTICIVKIAGGTFTQCHASD